MDPVVRVALSLQRLVAKVAGSLLAVGLGAYLVVWSVNRPPDLVNAGALGVFLLSFGTRVASKLRGGLGEGGPRWLDAEILLHLLVGAYALVLGLPGGLDGPAYALVYAVTLLGASFTTPLATALAVGFAVLLEAAVGFGSLGQLELERLTAHGTLLALFASLNLLVFRAELSRIKRLSRQRIDAELSRMRDAARSYRLLGAPTNARDHSMTPAPDDTERLICSGVDEIHQAVEFALSLLQKTLGLRTALLLGLDASGQALTILELTTSEDAILPGPFGVQGGIFGACLEAKRQVSISGPRTAVHLPYYSVRPAVGSACATPLDDHGRVRGILVVDREAREAFTPHEEETLKAAAHFVQRAIDNERVFVQLDRAKVEQGKLYRAANALAAATTEAQVIEAGVNGAREFASFDFAVVTLFDRQSQVHEICAASGEGTAELIGQRYRHNSGLVSMVVANRHALPYRGDYDPARQVVFTRQLAPPPMPSLLVLPLLVHDRPLGTLILGSKRRGAFGDSVRPTLEVLTSHVAVSLANARMLKRLEELATTDGLTQLYNKRALIDVAVQKVKSAARFSRPLSVLVCDIDHFKRVNDTHGHDVGDVVIKGLADVLRRVKRDTDAVGRFGGEEFVVVCEETDERGACQLAERVRQELAASSFHTELGPLHVTCSVGVAAFPAAGQTWEALFKATDEALYASKRGGRDRVTAWSPRLQGAA
ncbi:MAG TPA: diguanylate cyclase [Polyangiaceae bacterium]|nr:diguanylate cyclase [Polyangiaceae bacterium]